jgi:hypothetical protein
MMKTTVGAGVFKPAQSRNEARHDAINRSARDIINQEATARSKMTERLRADRLARDAAAEPVPAPATKAKRRSKANAA